LTGLPEKSMTMRIHNCFIAFLRPGLRGLGMTALLLAAAAVPAQYNSGNYNSSFGQSNNNYSSMYNQNSSSMGSSYSNSNSSFGSSNSSFGSSNSSFGSSNSSFGSSSGRNSELNRESNNRRGRNSRGKKIGSAKKKSTVVKRKGEAKGKAKGGGKAGPPLAEIKLDPLQINDALYLAPAFREMRQGDRFTTTLCFFNSAKHKIDEVNLWIHYDPARIEPGWINAGALEKLSGEAPQVKAWRERGYIQIQAKLKHPIHGITTDLLKVHWQATTAAIAPTLIELSPPPGEEVAVLEGSKNLVATTGLGNTARVSARLTINPPGNAAPGLVLANAVSQALSPPPTSLKERLRLALVTSNRIVGTGEEATADVVLLNPSALVFDDLRFRIRFDPHAVKILDSDEDNYISSGVNIYDGGFHDQYPFDVHLANNVDSQHGVIDYHVATSEQARAFPSGTLARIVYKMKSQAGRAAFWFEQVDPATHERVTNVTSAGRSLLGDSPATAADALHGMEVLVRPLALGEAAPAKPLAAGAGH